jgi:hypothetical protein
VNRRDDPGWVSLLAAILRDLPLLPDPLCRDRYVLFDPPEPFEAAEAVAHRHEAAKRICENCGALEMCRAMLDGLPRNRRPAGVVAGRLPDGGRAAA